MQNATALWSLFLAGVISVGVVVVAFGAALVIAQRRRMRMQQQHAQRVLKAHEEERAWIAGELHDDALQRIAMIRLELDSLRGSVAGAAGSEELERFGALNAELLDLGVALRTLAQRLHPAIVDHVGLAKAIEALAGEMQRAHGLEVELHSDGRLQELPSQTAHAAYRIVQESLRNVARHSGSKTARVDLESRHGTLTLRIQDAGRGFVPTNRHPEGHGLGIVAMQERATYVNGSLSIRSVPGSGTTVEAHFPLAEN